MPFLGSLKEWIRSDDKILNLKVAQEKFFSKKMNGSIFFKKMTDIFSKFLFIN